MQPMNFCYDLRIIQGGQVMARLGTALLVLLLAIGAHAEEIRGNITEVTSDYGNLDTDITYMQLEELGCGVGDEFVIIHGEQRVTAHFGETYGDVPRGEWVGLLNSMGNLRLARNYDNAAETLGVKSGDEIAIATVEAETTP